MELGSCHSLHGFRNLMASLHEKRQEMAQYERAMLRPGPVFAVPGYCWACNRDTSFQVSYDNCFTGDDGTRMPNWREHLVCPICGLNNRMRAALMFMTEAVDTAEAVYLTEQVTPLYKATAARFPHLIGSEYLRDGTAPGRTNPANLRHEDVTALTLEDGSFACIGSFDVLEHVPDYMAGLHEFARCLRPGGRLLMTVPFALGSHPHVIRAELDADGGIRHIMPPEYHGDPLDTSGVLCFRHFGWALIEDLRLAGFRNARMMFFWSSELGHLGGMQSVLEAVRQ
ncbi:class I SAM-dependent methyltransferase [Belnapia sp. T18]|uniref:Class I SAM-dependent methyltransferase n=1 Tax=Belnapia arida TaxID=2804533 RepID=A0ABS1UDF1_9PROT|nr:class I SAM-dependent methyltransferase [Belnapia arida]MBL6082729.1 class I SAM-dependent methyltransferase [Belnapia arida]